MPLKLNSSSRYSDLVQNEINSLTNFKILQILSGANIPKKYNLKDKIGFRNLLIRKKFDKYILYKYNYKTRKEIYVGELSYEKYPNGIFEITNIYSIFRGGLPHLINAFMDEYNHPPTFLEDEAHTEIIEGKFKKLKNIYKKYGFIKVKSEKITHPNTQSKNIKDIRLIEDLY